MGVLFIYRRSKSDTSRYKDFAERKVMNQIERGLREDIMRVLFSKTLDFYRLD